jgi:capsid protein
VDQWSRRENCDIGKRHSLSQMIRLRAAGEYLDGDGALLKLSSLKLQGIEGDNIRSPDYKTDIAGMPEEAKKSIQGLILDRFNAVQKYVICMKTENPGRYKFAALVDAENIIYGGNFFRFDQIRGVPALNTAANTAQDVKEIDEYQLQKVKMHAMHALVFKSDASTTGYNEAPIAGIAGNSSGTVANTPQYQFELDSGLKMELNPGDSVDMLESKTPSREYKEFSELMMRKFFLTLEGLPYEFFNCGNASYSAMKHIRAEFKFGIQLSELKNRDIRYSVLEWALPALLVQNGIRLSKKFAGNKIFRFLTWLPQAEPWLEEDREVSAALARIDGGLSNLEDEAARRGKNAYDVLRGTQRVQSYIKKSKIVSVVGMPGAVLWNADTMNNSTAAGSSPAAPSPADASTSGGGTSQPDNNGANNDSAN